MSDKVRCLADYEMQKSWRQAASERKRVYRVDLQKRGGLFGLDRDIANTIGGVKELKDIYSK